MNAPEQDGPEAGLGGTEYTRSQLADIPPVEPLIGGIMSRRASNLIVGATGVNKTFFALSMACSLASGEPWLGRRVQQCPVLYVVGEGASGLDARIAAWEGPWHQKVPDGLIFRVKPNSLAYAKTWAALEARALDLGAGYVVVDTFSSTAPDADEVRDAPKITRWLGDLAGAVDGTASLVHHSGWGDQGRARGGSQLECNVDEVLVLAGIPTEPLFSVTRKKVKEGEAGEVIWLRRARAKDSCYIESSSAAEAEVPLRDRVIVVLTDYAETGATGPQIALGIGLGAQGDRSGMYRVMRHLAAKGEVKKIGGRGQERYFMAGMDP